MRRWATHRDLPWGLGGARSGPGGAGHALARRARQAPHHVRDALTHVRGEAGEHLRPLGDPVGPHPAVEPPPRRRDVEQHGPCVARMRGACDVALALERGDHAARRALVQTELSGEGIERRGASAHEGIEGVALGQGNVVATDAVALAHEIGTDEVRERLVEGFGVVLESLIAVAHVGWYLQLYQPMRRRVKAAILA